MNELDLILARVNINTTIAKLKLSTDEIKQKNPQRIDLTNSMEDSIGQLVFSVSMYDVLEKEYRTARLLSNNYCNHIMQLEERIRLLEKQNKLLLEGL